MDRFSYVTDLVPDPSALPSPVLILVATVTSLLLLSIISRIGSELVRSYRKLRDAQIELSPCGEPWNYTALKQIIHNENITLPAMFVDLDIFDENTKYIVDNVKRGGKTLRMATKSIRCPFLIKRIFKLADRVARGFMCYAVEEAALLAEDGLNDFFIPYPTVQQNDVTTAFNLLANGTKITLIVDDVSQVACLNKLSQFEVNKTGRSHLKLPVAVDLDLSYKMFGGKIHLGAHRSRIDSIDKFARVARAIRSSEYLRIVGVMGYEAHIAGLTDNNPFASLPNILVRFMKSKFQPETVKFRLQIAEYCKKNDIRLEFYNGGGSGNIEDACADPAITEVTAGSGFLQAQLFDYYVDNKCKPAMVFALQTTRINDSYLVCQSGGFIASGAVCKDKVPRPYDHKNPLCLEAYPDEGFGEVQTPLRIRGANPNTVDTIGLGDPVLFRPAKSGEIAEHFNAYYLIQNGECVGKVKTYRGLGHVFY